MLRLFSDTQTLNNGSVSLDVLLLDVIQKPASLSNELQEASAGMMILLVHLEMLRQVFNSTAQKRNLYLRRSRIRLVVTGIPK